MGIHWYIILLHSNIHKLVSNCNFHVVRVACSRRICFGEGDSLYHISHFNKLFLVYIHIEYFLKQTPWLQSLYISYENYKILPVIFDISYSLNQYSKILYLAINRDKKKRFSVTMYETMFTLSLSHSRADTKQTSCKLKIAI